MALLFGTTLRILDAYKPERIQSTFAAVCKHHFSKLPYYTRAEALHSLKLHTLRDRRRRPEALFLLIFPLALYVIVSFVIKLLEFQFLLGLSENFFCWEQAVFAMIVPPARCASVANVFKLSIYLDNKPCFLIAFRFSFCASYILNFKSMCKWNCIN
jgi:hypothetical protein